jgi:transcription elongation factor GreA
MEAIEMTQVELDKLRDELNELESGGRAEIASRIKTAREWGDLKENAEYHAAKESQAHLETKILRLKEQVRSAVVVEQKLTGSVVHGSQVTVTDLKTEKQQNFKIVSPNEAAPKDGLMSSASPIAAAVLGHQVGETVEVEVPAGVRRLRVDAIA